MRKNQIRKFIKYDIHTGIFTNRKSGKIIGNIISDGYIQIWLDGNKYRADKLAWFYVTGFWPECDIIHINGVNSDNWLSNLKEYKKRKIRTDNITGIVGVFRDKKHHKWRSQITSKYKRRDLGSYEKFDNAVLARMKAEQVLGIKDSPAQQYIKKIFL